MPRSPADVTISVAVDRDEHAALREWARAERTSLSAVVRDALNEYLKRRGMPPVAVRKKQGRPGRWVTR